jgi:hypothetical protein
MAMDITETVRPGVKFLVEQAGPRGAKGRPISGRFRLGGPPAFLG